MRVPAVQYDHYYSYPELAEFLQALAAAAPERVRLHSLYTTPEGREEWLVEVTDRRHGDPLRRPAYLVHANLHAVEVAGTTAALVLLEQLLTRPGLDGLLADVAFHVIPRLNPDGAEYTLRTGAQLRSTLALRPCRNGLRPADLNGDGEILHMRWEDPCGPFCVDSEDRRLLVPRRRGDRGPFYQMTQEGVIEDYDGGPIAEGTRGSDFNRNFGYNWQPEHVQWGAGDYAFSHPEMRAVADWVYSHPGLFGMLGFHNGCEAFLRPSASVPDEELPAADLRQLQDLGQAGERLTRFRLRAVRDYHGADSPPLSLKGHFTDWGYFGLGLYVFEIELGNLYNAAGISTSEYFEADAHTREVLFRRRCLRYADDLPGRGFRDWQWCDHPQLGRVEVGGMPATGWATPPAAALEQSAPRCTDFILDHACRRPVLEVRQVEAEWLEGHLYRLRATVVNTGALPTYLSQQGKQIAANGPVTIRLRPGPGVRLVSRGQVRELPGLEALRGYVDLEWFLQTEHDGGEVTIEAYAPKAGSTEQVVALIPGP